MSAASRQSRASSWVCVCVFEVVLMGLGWGRRGEERRGEEERK
jgi:hypothetical protein